MKGACGRRRGSPELCSAAGDRRRRRSGGYRDSFGLRFGAKERTRHAWSTGVDSGVLRGSEQGARRWRRLGVAAHGGGGAGLHQNGDSGLAFERKMIRKRERDKLNRSRAWRRATARRRPGAAARRVCGTLARNLARDRDRPTEKKEARGGSLQPCEAPGTSGRRRRAAL